MSLYHDQAGAPWRPGLDTLTYVLMAGYDFARDAGGELFALPGPALPEAPYIPRSFLTSSVTNLAHMTWREMATAFNSYRAEHPDAGKPVAFTPSSTLVNNAVRHAEAMAAEHGRRVTAELRAVQAAGGIVIDLGDETGDVIWVTADGWKVTGPRALPSVPPVFRRSTGYGPLSRPEHPECGGDLAALWKILRLDGKDEDAARARHLITGWLTAAFFACTSRPGLWLTGPPGSGKTTIGCALARLIDGTEWLDGKLADGKKADTRDNIIRAVKCYVVSFDNMSSVTADLSDWICTLVTGREDTFRKMKTNFDDVSMAYKRTFIATGLSLPYGLRADAMDRVIEVPLPPLGRRRVSEERLRRMLDAARPLILGAVLDRVAAVLGRVGSIPENLESMTRMSGYANILLAHDAAYGAEDGQATPVLAAYLAAAKAAQEDRAAAEPVIAALGKLFANPGPYPVPWCACAGCTAKPQRLGCLGSTWQGIAQDLWNALSPYRNLSAFNGGDTWWPADAQRLSDHLTEIHDQLATAGFTLSRSSTRTKRGRLLTIGQPPEG